MKYDLVFEGGGAKGMVLVGAYEEFARRGHSHGRLLGTSAGAISATLLAAGYTPDEMQAALNEQKDGRPVFASFMGVPLPFTAEEVRSGAIRALLRDIDVTFVPGFIEDRMDDAIAQTLANDPRSRHMFAFVERGGWYAADAFVAWLQNKLDSGTFQDKPRQFSQNTLAQFHAATQVDLSLVVSDTSEGRLLVLNHRTAPDCSLVWAVRMSMSIPLVWDEVIWDARWGAYLGQPIAGHAMVDGGLLSNFPIELFISGEPQVTRLMGPKGSDPVLGLLIDESLPVPPLAEPAVEPEALVQINVKPQELRTVQRILRLVNTATTAHDKMVIDEFNHLVVRLPAAGYGTTEFDMSEERRKALVQAGRTAVARYFDQPPVEAPTPSGPAAAAARSQDIADRIALDILGQ